ncbi:MAG: molybdopterin-dependent oxidoreductase [Actinobacteria bacterium]|nr:molybdopterin-dependent oxidoreductase [Actinomycetota bacterium]
MNVQSIRKVPLPVENGRPRVQRLVDELPPLHIELEPPVRNPWTLTIDGLVKWSLELTLDGLRSMGTTVQVNDFHCVWGWSRPGTRWTGVPTGVLLDAAEVDPRATHVRFEAVDSPYASCVPIEQARDGLLAIGLELKPLPAVNGGPLRWLQPHYLWGYKGVKWLGSIEVIDSVQAGPWETRVGDIEGRVPDGLVDRFSDLRERGGLQ